MSLTTFIVISIVGSISLMTFGLFQQKSIEKKVKLLTEDELTIVKKYRKRFFGMMLVAGIFSCVFSSIIFIFTIDDFNYFLSSPFFFIWVPLSIWGVAYATSNQIYPQDKFGLVFRTILTIIFIGLLELVGLFLLMLSSIR